MTDPTKDPKNSGAPLINMEKNSYHVGDIKRQNF